MFDHISLAVTDLVRTKRFYDAALAPLGVSAGETDGRTASYVRDGRDSFTLIHSDHRPVAPYGTHFCFQAATRGAVRAFHRHGVDAGGQDDGAPGLRPHYGATYYAALLIDPEGYRIEAVCHAPDE